MTRLKDRHILHNTDSSHMLDAQVNGERIPLSGLIKNPSLGILKVCVRSSVTVLVCEGHRLM